MPLNINYRKKRLFSPHYHYIYTHANQTPTLKKSLGPVSKALRTPSISPKEFCCEAGRGAPGRTGKGELSLETASLDQIQIPNNLKKGEEGPAPPQILQADVFQAIRIILHPKRITRRK